MANLVGNPIITNAGRAALLAGEFAIADIQLGDDGDWTPSPTANWLWNPEKVLTPEVQVEEVDGGVRLHLAAIDQSDSAYTVREFALRDASGTALALHAQLEPIASKAASSTLVLAIDLAVADANEAAIQVGDTNFLMPAATEQTAGVVRRASPAGTVQGTDATSFVSPFGLQRKLDTEFPGGRLRLQAHADRALMPHVQSVAAALTDITGVAEQPGAGRMVACATGGRVYTTEDYGANWTLNDSLTGQDFVFAHYAPARQEFAVVEDSAIWVTPAGPGFGTWSAYPSGFPGLAAVATDATGRVVATTGSGQFGVLFDSSASGWNISSAVPWPAFFTHVDVTPGPNSRWIACGQRSDAGEACAAVSAPNVPPDAGPWPTVTLDTRGRDSSRAVFIRWCRGYLLAFTVEQDGGEYFAGHHISANNGLSWTRVTDIAGFESEPDPRSFTATLNGMCVSAGLWSTHPDASELDLGLGPASDLEQLSEIPFPIRRAWRLPSHRWAWTTPAGLHIGPLTVT